jgi:hypothetical protein
MSEQTVKIVEGAVDPENLDYAALAAEFSPEEQNAAAWLSVVLLLAENRAYCDALRKLMLSKGLATEEEINSALGHELTQPQLGNWYGFMNQLYSYRVAETLDLQKQKREGTLPDESPIEEDLTKVSGGPPIPTGPPPKEDIIAGTTINPPMKGDPDVSPE